MGIEYKIKSVASIEQNGLNKINIYNTYRMANNMNARTNSDVYQSQLQNNKSIMASSSIRIHILCLVFVTFQYLN